MSNYLFIRELGRGAYGVVNLVQNIETQKLYVQKIIRLDNFEVIEREEKVLKFIKNNCERYLTCVDKIEKKDDAMIITMDYIPNSEDLYLYRSTYNIDTDKFILAERMIEGLNFLHNLGVVHRDVKPENILVIDKFNIKYIDYGSSCIKNDIKCLQAIRVGTLMYNSPQHSMASYREKNGIQPYLIVPNTFENAKQDDIWSLGLVLFFLWFNNDLFVDKYVLESDDSIISRIMNLTDSSLEEFFNNRIKNIGIPIDERFLQIIKSMVVVDPNKRKSLSDILIYIKTINNSNTRNTIQFYNNSNIVNNISFEDVLKWDDYEIETKIDSVMPILFPDDKEIVENFIMINFIKDTELRKLVTRITLKMLRFYGFTIDPNNWSIVQIKPIKRIENGQVVGLYSLYRFNRITQILKFLEKIQMKQLSALFFLAICMSMNYDVDFQNLVKKHNALNEWINTQPFLDRYKENIVLDSDIRHEAKNWADKDYSSSSSDREYDPYGPYGPYGENQENTCASFRGLDYTGNSCYQDSTLLALFAIPNVYINKEILEKNIVEIINSPKKYIICSENSRFDYEIRKNIQNELIRITASMRGLGAKLEYCSNLRMLFRQCPGSQEFHNTETQDAGEFLQYLFNIFQLKGLIKRKITYLTNDIGEFPNLIISSDITIDDTPILSIDPNSIKDRHSVNISNFLENTEDSFLGKENAYLHTESGIKYIRRIETINVISAPYLVFYCQRLYYHTFQNRIVTKRLNTKIIPSETINYKKGSKIIRLKLHAIIVHESNHYTCYIKCGNTWFYYNDNPGALTHSIVPIGSYEKMLASRPDPELKGVLYFYI